MQIFTHHLYRITAHNEEVACATNDEPSQLLYFCQNHHDVYVMVFHNSQSFSILNKKISKYLTAYPNQELSFDADQISAFQTFYILPENELNLVKTLFNHYHDNFGQLITSCKIQIENSKLYLKFGNTLIQPSYIPLSTITQTAKELIYKNPNQELIFKRKNVLIYYCVYGKREYFDCLRLSILSLVNFGQYEGDILVKCDHPEFLHDLQNEIKNKIIIKTIDEKLGIFNRYVFEDEFFNYDFVHYLDADILTINPYLHFYNKINDADLYVYSEIPEQNPEAFKQEKEVWFGVDFFHYFKIDHQPYYLNSGFFVINNHDNCKKFFDRVLQYRVLESQFGDQPFFNLSFYNSDIVLHELARGDDLQFTDNATDLYENLHQIFMHYNIGVGKLTKLQLMQHNYNHLINNKAH